MSLDKPSLTVRPELLVKESLTKIEANLEILEVRGGIGNRLVSYLSKDYTDREHQQYDYKPGSPQPKEWANIEIGRDTFKLTPNEKAIIRNGIMSVMALICSLVAWLVFY